MNSKMSIRIFEGKNQINFKAAGNTVVSIAPETYQSTEFTLDAEGKISGATISSTGLTFTIGKDQAVLWAKELQRLNSGIDIYCLEDCL